MSLAGLALAFLKIGTIGFGGGMAVIALMENEFVRKRQIIDSEEFAHGVGLSQVLGPFAVNTALFLGYRAYGVVGGLITAVAFILPSFALVLVLSWVYFTHRTFPGLQGAVAGLGPAVIALIVSAAWSMGRKSLQSWPAAAIISIASIAGLYKFNPAYILFAAGTLGLMLGQTRLAGENSPLVAGQAADARPPKEKLRAGVMLGYGATQALKTVGGVSLFQVASAFLKVGVLFFGGGFVLIPVLHQTLVVNLGWLSPQEFIDGVGISSLTPGPLTVLAAFAGYRVRGPAGALVATFALYLPAVILMLALCRGYERLKGGIATRAFLAGIVPAVVGLVLSAGIVLAPGTLHSWRGYIFAALALLVLIRWRLHPALVLATGALAGVAGLLP